MCGINNIKTKSDLANILNISKSNLTYVLYVKKVENMYISFDIPKKNGGVRKINAPKNFLKFIQRNLARALSIYKRDIYKNDGLYNEVRHLEK